MNYLTNITDKTAVSLAPPGNSLGPASAETRKGPGCDRKTANMRNTSRTTIKRIKRNYPADWAWALKIAKGNIQKAAKIAVDEIFFPVDFWPAQH